jgi:hypothetical protein
MANIVDKGVAVCPKCGTDASYEIEETEDGRLDSVITCPKCERFRREGIDHHADFPPPGTGDH